MQEGYLGPQWVLGLKSTLGKENTLGRTWLPDPGPLETSTRNRGLQNVSRAVATYKGNSVSCLGPQSQTLWVHTPMAV